MFKHDPSFPTPTSCGLSRHLHRRPTSPLATPAERHTGTRATTRLRRPSRQAAQKSSAAPLLELLAAEARIAKLETALSAARAAASTDALTGALNRRGFAAAYDREVARAARTGKCLALALLDLDDFKRLNDTLGHEAGDEALVHLVTRLRQALRPTDVVCRFGGEEFVLLLPETTLFQAEAVLQRFQREFSATPLPRWQTTLSFSAGVVVREACETIEETLARADTAAYAAKRAGKNCVVRA